MLFWVICPKIICLKMSVCPKYGKFSVSNKNRIINSSIRSFLINLGLCEYISDAYMGNICGAEMYARLQRAVCEAPWDFTVT